VADVAGRMSILDQIRLIAWLRWKILRNHLRRKNNWLDLIGMIAAVFWGGVGILGVAVTFAFGARRALSSGSSIWLTLLFLAVLAFWQIVPLFVAGFGINFEFRTLLRFPLKLRAFYLIALSYGFADFGPIASLCWLIGIIIGGGIAQPSALPAMIVVAVLFILLNVTLERLTGSWMERLLSRRLTRELTFGLIILLSVSAQFIRPLVQRFEHGPPHSLLLFLPYLSFLPPALATRAVTSTIAHDLGSAAMSALGLALYVVLFSALLWRRYAAQYRGEELSEASAPATVARRPLAPTEAPGFDMAGFVSPQVAAVIRKEFRYLIRNAFIMIGLLVPPFLVLLFSSQFAGRRPSVVQHSVSPDIFYPGMMGYLLLMLMMPVYNSFAYEGKGIQTYFMAPLRFRDVLLGKNLIHVGVVTLQALLAIAILTWRIGPPSLPVFVATLVGGVFAAAGQFPLANWTSLGFPRKLEFGSMRGQRGSGVSVWVGFGAQIVLGSVCSLVLLMGRWTDRPWLPAEAFLLLAVAAIAGYRASLDPLSDLAEKKKENLIEMLCR
jgi:ABC-2 type transport system permease protein